MKDTDFYNKESGMYARKRYPSQARTFTQFFFKERLRLTLQLLAKYMPAEGNVSLLEIGCADGVVARAIWGRFGERFSRIEAMDISPLMIEVAKRSNAGTSVRFFVREGIELQEKYEFIVEVGVLNYLTLGAELDVVRSALLPGGMYICSISGESSLQTALKGDEGFMHLRSYTQYEQEFAKHFKMVRNVPIGFFVPWLWKIPTIARMLQPMIERIALTLVPNLAHEKIYLLTGYEN